jgi:hypothetical protein
MLRFLQVVAIASLVSTRAVLPRLLKISRRKHSVTSRTVRCNPSEEDAIEHCKELVDAAN